MKWKIVTADGDAVCRQYPVGRLAGALLAAAGADSQQIQELLEEDMPLGTSQAECVLSACQRIQKAAANHEKVMIAGDYDCDGVCATAIMKDTLDRLGVVNGYYIPDRFREGYGLAAHTVELAKQKGYSLLITVDNGVKAHAALKCANALGLETIVTDHHQIEEEVETGLLVHPSKMEEDYCYLSGAGVALQISRNLLGTVELHTALAALAAVGDVMPLWKQTRRIVKAGFAAVNSGFAPSILPLLQGRQMDYESAGFQAVPRLNSVGRMNDLSNVNTLVPYLLCHDQGKISRYASQLETVNSTRRQLSEMMSAKAGKMLDDSPFYVLYDESFVEGICGLVAGRIANEYHRPVLVMASHEDLIKGSGRSVPGFNLFDFFASGFEELTAFGGHEQAVGLALKKTDFESFRAKVEAKMAASGFAYQEAEETAVSFDPALLTLDELRQWKRLDPWPREFGQGLIAIAHPRVLKVLEGPKVTKILIASDAGPLEGIFFSYQKLVVPEHIGAIIAHPGIHTWHSTSSVQLQIVDFVA